MPDLFTDDCATIKKTKTLKKTKLKIKKKGRIEFN